MNRQSDLPSANIENSIEIRHNELIQKKIKLKVMQDMINANNESIGKKTSLLRDEILALVSNIISIFLINF